MAYDSETMEVLHALTPAGKRQYEKTLELKANEILFKAVHPIKWLKAKIFSEEPWVDLESCQSFS